MGINNYVIYKEQQKNGCMKRLVKGHRIRVDVFNGFQLWKVKELLKCKNWKIRDSNKEKVRNTYYIDIL